MEIYIADTSSIIAVREYVAGAHVEKVFDALTQLVRDGQLTFPPEVYKELKRSADRCSGRRDFPFEWIKNASSILGRRTTKFEHVKRILNNPLVNKVVDPGFAGGDDEEEADIYVLAMAQELRESNAVVVLTEERRDRPNKISMATACGHLRLVDQNMKAFLQDSGLHMGPWAK
jgi:rRNA maturation endonuclease Nob1